LDLFEAIFIEYLKSNSATKRQLVGYIVREYALASSTVIQLTSVCSEMMKLITATAPLPGSLFEGNFYEINDYLLFRDIFCRSGEDCKQVL
jgi:hypothetical protein